MVREGRREQGRRRDRGQRRVFATQGHGLGKFRAEPRRRTRFRGGQERDNANKAPGSQEEERMPRDVSEMLFPEQKEITIPKTVCAFNE